MKKFRVLLNGRNFLLDMGYDGLKKHGFFTTRWVKANDEVEAENSAVEMVRQCSQLRSVVLNEKDDPPEIFLEEIDVAVAFEYFRRKPGKGYIFYPEDGGEENREE